MRAPIRSVFILLAFYLAWGTVCWTVVQAQDANELKYTILVPDTEQPKAVVELLVPARNAESVELMMPIWSPGFYRIENYSENVAEVEVVSPSGAKLDVERTANNRWRVSTHGEEAFVFRYQLECKGRSVTTNSIGSKLGVFNGPSTFVSVIGRENVPHSVTLSLPDSWPDSSCGLDSPTGQPYTYAAANYDELIDSPIIAGEIKIHKFVVDNSEHIVASVGEVNDWDCELAAKNIEEIVKANHEFWGFIPFKRYVFLNVFRKGGGGLEHLNSTLLTSQSSARGPSSSGWLGFVAHEYFHAYNVKRLRPIELGPFDYEHPPRTPSLWISEGLTSYFGELLVRRAGLESDEQYLNSLSGYIAQLQNSNGRLKQSLLDASNSVWDSGMSGVVQNSEDQVSYYVKGPIVGFLLDAKIREATSNQKSLDDVMKTAYERFSGRTGFAHAEFLSIVEEVAGADFKEWFHRSLASTEELDYQPALDWFGLEFMSDNPDQKWHLRVRSDVSKEQKNRLREWLGK